MAKYQNEKTAEQIENNFKYRPVKDDQAERYNLLRSLAKNLARAINANCPDSREKALAITNLEESVVWSIEAISRNE